MILWPKTGFKRFLIMSWVNHEYHLAIVLVAIINMLDVTGQISGTAAGYRLY
jgi:hypothetical protein